MTKQRDDSERKVSAILSEFISVDRAIDATLMAAFVEVARTPGIRMKELQDRLKLASSSTTRTCQVLSKEGKPGKSGYGLIRIALDPLDRRSRTLSLTLAGERLWRNLVDIVGR